RRFPEGEIKRRPRLSRLIAASASGFGRAGRCLREIASRMVAGPAEAKQGRDRSVQLRLRLRLVPVWPRRDVLQLRLEQVVQELLLRVLHLREDFAGGRRADAIDGV